jgi:hypothetical protein
LRFSKNSYYDYVIQNFNLLNYSVKELEKKGLAILLPFYVLKLRKQVEKAAPGAERKKFSAPMRKLLDNLEEAVENCSRKGQIDEQDALDIIKDLERLHLELYGKYEEFAEENIMAKEKFVRYSTLILEEKALKIAGNMLADGDSPERAAKIAELPLAKVKALLKTTKVKQSA